MCERPYSHILSLVFSFFIIHLLLFKVQTFSSFLSSNCESHSALFFSYSHHHHLFYFLLSSFYFFHLLCARVVQRFQLKKNCWGCVCSRVECHTPRPQESDTWATILPPHPCFLGLVFNQIQVIVMLKGVHFFIPNQRRSKTECII